MTALIILQENNEPFEKASSTKKTANDVQKSPETCATTVVGAYRVRSKQVLSDKSNKQRDDSDKEGVLVSCPVKVIGDLRSRRDEFQDKVQVFGFEDFEGLSEYMNATPNLKQNIERRQEKTLKEIHEKFRGIVQEIIEKHRLYHSELARNKHSSTNGCGTNHVSLYATPNVRLRTGTYANFLHADALFDYNENNNKTSYSPVVMINIWISLNDTPPSNQLMFCQVPNHHHQGINIHPTDTSVVYGDYHHLEGKTLVYDEEMTWGSFYCFVSGQTKSVPNVFLHGAVDVAMNTKEANANKLARKSIELRYLV